MSQHRCKNAVNDAFHRMYATPSPGVADILRGVHASRMPAVGVTLDAMGFRRSALGTMGPPVCRLGVTPRDELGGFTAAGRYQRTMTPARSAAAPIKSVSSTPCLCVRPSTVTSRYGMWMTRTAKPRTMNDVPSQWRTTEAYGSIGADGSASCLAASGPLVDRPCTRWQNLQPAPRKESVEPPRDALEATHEPHGSTARAERGRRRLRPGDHRSGGVGTCWHGAASPWATSTRRSRHRSLPSEVPIEQVGSLRFVARHQVAIAVECDRDGRMPHVGAHGL
jgi:hypothetical protein